MLSIRRNVPLAPLTTLGLGGPADEFASCTTVDDLRQVLGAVRGILAERLAGQHAALHRESKNDRRRHRQPTQLRQSLHPDPP
jgi:UDP-N-acetylenolpyruvoylglucosamine reductase